VQATPGGEQLSGTPISAPTSVHPVTSGSAATGSSAEPVARVLAFARAQLGKPYVWGGIGPGGFDCSGLVMRAWQAGDVQLPRTAAAQAHAGVPTTRAGLVAGDLIITDDDGHVELYIGGGQVIYAPHTGQAVHTGPLPPAGQVDAYVHIPLPAPTTR
jgi:cell wall-associated NlpC family hydrolase